MTNKVDDNGTIYSYKYNVDGIRTEKVVNGVTTKYHLEGSKIVFEYRNGSMLYYMYNGDELLGFKYNENTYYYHKNIFGDIIGILDTNYNEVVTYEYDGWGAISSIVDNSGINLGTINPFRYRSYYYDEENKLYYLNSRYYNPEWGKFINADALITGNGLNSNNLYCYCNNEPISQEDSNGYFVSLIKKGVVGGFISSITKLTSNIVLKKPILEDVGTSFVTGVISGVIDGLFDNYFINLGMSIMFETYDVVNGNSTITEAVCNVGIDALFSAIEIDEIEKATNSFKISKLSDKQKQNFSYITQASGEYTKNITNDTIKKSSDKKNIANNSYSKNNTIKEKLLPRKLRKPKSPPKNAREFIEMSNNKSIPSETWTTIINTINMGYCKL